jgi:hypothetical protein
VLGGMEVLQCYNPHRTEGFCTIGVLQRCYRGATGCYAPWPEGAETAETLTQRTQRTQRERESLRAKGSPGAQRTLLNSLRLTWCLGVLVDAVALLRNLALLQGLSRPHYWSSCAPNRASWTWSREQDRSWGDIVFPS